MNLQGIHLDMDELITKYNGKIGSVSDSNEIQQISLFCQQNKDDYRNPVLMDMINPMFAYAGLYPHVMKSFNPEISDKITEKGREILKELLKKRIDARDIK